MYAIMIPNKPTAKELEELMITIDNDYRTIVIPIIQYLNHNIDLRMLHDKLDTTSVESDTINGEKDSIEFLEIWNVILRQIEHAIGVDLYTYKIVDKLNHLFDQMM